MAGAALLALAVFCVFVAGEEISWAQRMFAFTPPDYFLEENFQQELNVHNLMKGRELWGIPLDSRVLVGIAAAGYGLVLPLAVRLLPGSVGAFLGSTAPSTAILWSFAAVAWAEAAYPISLAGEACELALGVAFVAAALETLRVAPGGDAAQEATGHLRLSVVSLVGPLALGGLTAVALAAVFAAGDEDRIAQTRAEIVALATDLEAGVATRRLLRKRSIHKRLYTSVAVGYLKFGRDSKFLDGQLNPAEAPDGEGRRDRQGYFLDPWSNPYWIRTKQRSGEVVVYSFGPNRKRDSDMDDALTFSGVGWSTP